MTKEQAIEEIYKAFEPAYANYIITALAEGATISDKALKPCDDCVSRQAVIEYIKASDAELGHDCENEYVREDILNMPSVTPTHCIATVKFNKEELREICNERIEVECTHGTCKDCENWDGKRYCTWIGIQTEADFYCKDFKKRGNENGSN